MRLLAAFLIGVTIVAGIVCGWIADALNAALVATIAGF